MKYTNGILSAAMAIAAAGTCLPAMANSSISKMVGGQTLTISTLGTLAESIYSLNWGATEFVNYSDHGREIQSSVSILPCGEAFNPTEAGSDANGSWQNGSSSQNTGIAAANGQLQTSTGMAYWRTQTPQALIDQGCPTNLAQPSGAMFYKRVTIGGDGSSFPHGIKYEVTFDTTNLNALPTTLSYLTYEVVTAYLPSGTFPSTRAYTYTPNTSHTNLQQVSYTPYPAPNLHGYAYQQSPTPIILTNSDGTSRAMGLYIPPNVNDLGLVYRVDQMESGGVNKLTIRLDKSNPSVATAKAVKAFRVYLIVGSKENVLTTIDQMASNPGLL